MPKLKAKALMTPAELAFYRRLRSSADPLNIAPQVAMAAVLTTAGGSDRGQRRGARNRFDRKIIDFVLFDNDGAVQLLIELDDSTHQLAKDADRDRLTLSAGHKTLRLRGSQARDIDEIRMAIAAAISSSSGSANARMMRNWVAPR